MELKLYDKEVSKAVNKFLSLIDVLKNLKQIVIAEGLLLNLKD